ncbi:uncharacterized protein CC84DRAFT_1166698 [Paraphaeosphaeria sporulosa]|uniref:Uncharacterized protein n=1 Tax=Paraphaeosphaeria sporulosa TaxID=1460663 RepID=A0A177C5K8_9PLEO|nr:uncharacterized protein CC84DRAFT_1166698 [Paraphaeosphaeria sporulosa]OAG02903.1 hypothetical protein CC84DRAFT_1166698 [Paraphaeosphaeria sporulosa]
MAHETLSSVAGGVTAVGGVSLGVWSWTVSTSDILDEHMREMWRVSVSTDAAARKEKCALPNAQSGAWRKKDEQGAQGSGCRIVEGR